MFIEKKTPRTDCFSGHNGLACNTNTKDTRHQKFGKSVRMPLRRLTVLDAGRVLLLRKQLRKGSLEAGPEVTLALSIVLKTGRTHAFKTQIWHKVLPKGS